MNEVLFADIFVRYDENELFLGNSKFNRRIDLRGGAPRTVSLQNGSGREFADPDKKLSDAHFVGLPSSDRAYAQYHIKGIVTEELTEDIFEAARMTVRIEYADRFSGVSYTHNYIIYPHTAAHSVYNTLVTPVLPNVFWNHRRQARIENSRFNDPVRTESCVDSIRLAADIKPEMSVEFIAHTDTYDNQLCEHKLRADFSTATGNLLYCAADDGAGLAILQEAMVSMERRDLEEYDFRQNDREIFFCGWGISPSEIVPGREYRGCRNAVLLFNSPAERAVAVKDYLELRFRMPADKYLITVNPWGCGHFPELTSPEFLCAEIAAAAECGADYYQIDDTWQSGAGLGEILCNRQTDMSFWDISEKRMHGTFAPQVETARRHGIKLALWVAPTHTTGYRDHVEFAEFLLQMHERWGFDLIKVDGFHLRTLENEQNLEKILRTVREKTNGKVYFNLDTTNGQRQGYFHFLEYGNIFLENRYTCHDWSIGYHPEKTLRSLWHLSKYTRPQSLQIEIPAPHDINPQLYRKIAMSEPTAYPYEYWAAIALFASPLLWLAPSQLAAENRKTLNKLMQIHRHIRQDIFAGHIFPLGDEPTGHSLTGFFADAGYVLIFREAGAVSPDGELSCASPLESDAVGTLLAGNGELTVHNGKFMATLPESASFALFKLQ